MQNPPYAQGWQGLQTSSAWGSGPAARSCEEGEGAGGDVGGYWVSMSQRNIDLHRRLAAAINAREVPEELLAPGFRMENHVTAAVGEMYYGAAGWREWMSDLFEVLGEEARYETEEIIADGDDFVVTTLRIFGRSAHSGMPLVF